VYICNNCGQAAEPIIKTTRENLDGENGIETRTTAFCPQCGSQDLIQAEICPVCHEWMKQGRDCCKECGRKAKQALSDALSQLDPAQVKYLDFELDGVSLLDFWNES
jgi:ssDNA-binding Zn-finger/Zn-ribbon topoisomerase 1